MPDAEGGGAVLASRAERYALSHTPSDERLGANRRRIERLLFVAAWLAYGFFHQGGGWNQNSRFAMVRAVVEQGRFNVDDYIFYSGVDTESGAIKLQRTSIVDAAFTLGGTEFVLAWPPRNGEVVPMRDNVFGAQPAPIDRFAATGDLAYARGRFHPNKAPGVALLAVPGYFLVYWVERAVGIDPDALRVLTINAWLTTLLSVGLVSALGCVLMFRLALLLWPQNVWAAAATAVAFGFGTGFFPYATMMFGHNVVAVGLCASLYFLLSAEKATTANGAKLRWALSGATAGVAAISTYIAVVPVVMLAVYLFLLRRRVDALWWYGLGLLGPFLLICYYNWTCFGTPFTTNYHFQNPQFQENDAFLRVLGRPRLDRLIALLVSPFRGLFFSAPVLLMGVFGLVVMGRSREKRALTILLTSIFAFFFLFAISFHGWHGGWGVGPRYLLPGLPFLAVAVTMGFMRYPKITGALAALSVVTMGIFTVVDAQSPVGVSSISKYPGRAGWLRDPMTEYALPILVAGRAWPILNAQVEEKLRRADDQMNLDGVPFDEREAKIIEERERLKRGVKAGRADMPLTYMVGPVSANPIGIYAGWFGHLIGGRNPELRWNSFNAGEFVFPESRLSLLPLLILWTPLVASALRRARLQEQAVQEGGRGT